MFCARRLRRIVGSATTWLPGLSRLWARVFLVGREHAARGGGPGATRLGGMGHSSHDLLKASVAPRARGDNAFVLEGPDHVTTDPRLSLKRAVAIPHRHRERVLQLIATRPRSDVDQIVSDRPRQTNQLTPAASAPRERDDPKRSAARLELCTDPVTTEELVPARTEPASVDVRRLASRRRRAALARRRLKRWAAAPAPTPCDMEPREGRRLSCTTPQAPPPLAAARTDRCAAVRARHFEPGPPAAHLSSTESERWLN